MPWSSRTRAIAWRRVLAEPDTPRAQIAREIGIDPKALRDLIREKERETGKRIKARKRGRPKRPAPSADFLAAAHFFETFGKVDLAAREAIRAALRARRSGRPRRRYATPASRVIDLLEAPAALALLLTIVGDPQLRRESDHLDIEYPPEMSAEDLKQLKRAGIKSGDAKLDKQSDDGWTITTPAKLTPYAPAEREPAPLEIGRASLWLRKVVMPSRIEKLKEAHYLKGALRREMRRLKVSDSKLYASTREALGLRKEPQSKR